MVEDAVTSRERRRALLRLAFGSVQIMGASAGLYLLLLTGASVATGIVVGVTMIVSIVSRVLFSPKKNTVVEETPKPTKLKNT